MIKAIKFFAIMALGVSVLSPASSIASVDTNKKEGDPTTRSDAVIFKVHNVEPVSEEGVVTGCDFTVTLYNRTSLNFRSFTVNLEWEDKVDERFKFDKYIEGVMTQEELEKFKDVIKEEKNAKPLTSSITVNAFGADKQVSVRSHIDSEKCYLMLSDAKYTVSPCDIARKLDESKGMSFTADKKECSDLFQFVSTKNPEYFGKFKRISLTEEAQQEQIAESHELSDIDIVIGKIVDNMGVSDKTLNNIN